MSKARKATRAILETRGHKGRWGIMALRAFRAIRAIPEIRGQQAPMVWRLG